MFAALIAQWEKSWLSFLPPYQLASTRMSKTCAHQNLSQVLLPSLESYRVRFGWGDVRMAGVGGTQKRGRELTFEPLLFDQHCCR